MHCQWRSQRGEGQGGRGGWGSAPNPGAASTQECSWVLKSGAEPPATFLRQSRPGVWDGDPTTAAPLPLPPLATPLNSQKQ